MNAKKNNVNITRIACFKIIIVNSITTCVARLALPNQNLI